MSVTVSKALLPTALAALAMVPTMAAPAAPPNPYVDKGACPFECCTYRDWKITQPIILLDKPYGTRTIASVSAGQVVHAVTGDVYSVPVRTIAHKDYQVTSYGYRPALIKKGDVFYMLHYVGEGVSLIWFKGTTYEFDPEPVGVTMEGPPGDDNVAWWAKIQTPDGKTGWVRVKDQFENQDACG